MKKSTRSIACAVVSLAFHQAQAAPAATPAATTFQKPRVIATTDGERDGRA
jgi:hypothetical protein